MQSRLLKKIPATQVTRGDSTDADWHLGGDERRALSAVAQKFAPELKLRAGGLSPDEIRNLEFLRWRLSNR